MTTINVGKHVSETGGLLLFILAVLIHIADAVWRISGKEIPIIYMPSIMLYLGMAMFAAITLQDENTFIKRFGIYLLISLLAYILPFANYLSFLQVPKTIIGLIILFAPVWAIYLVSTHATSITGAIGAVYIFFWITVLFLSYGSMVQPYVMNAEIPGVMPGLTVSVIVSKAYTGLQTFAAMPTASIDKIRNEIDKSVQIAKTGVDPTQAKVDAANKAQVNVAMDMLRLVDANPYTTGPISIASKFTVKTLDNPTTLQLVCQDKTTNTPGKIFPQDTFEIETSEIQDIDCVFQPNTLMPGVHTITMSSDFNFKTISYIETFFMPEETLRELQNKNMDPLAGLPQPQATTTNGPINVNIHPPAAPIPSKEDKKITIGITILNTGGGKLKKINELYIYLPKGLVLSEESQEIGLYEKISCEDLKEKEICDASLAEIYRVSQTKLNSPQYKNIETGTEFRMYLTMQDYAELIGDAAIKPGSISASIQYEYQIENEINVNIKNPPETI